MCFCVIWNSKKEKDWLDYEEGYWENMNVKQKALERELENFDTQTFLDNLTGNSFKTFLRDKYFVWKYTAPNRLTTTLNKLETCTEFEMNMISRYLKDYCTVVMAKADADYDDMDYVNLVKAGLSLVTMIPELGIAGASGLLAILLPQLFGTVDQHVAKSLKELGEDIEVKHPDDLKMSEAVAMEMIMRKKAQKLNGLFKTDQWTPRRIDKILFTADK